MRNTNYLTASQSFNAMVIALENAKNISHAPGLQKATITINGLTPHIVVKAANELKVRCFGARADKNFVHTEFEPFEDKNVKIIFISRPVNSITMRGLNYASEIN